MNLHFDITPKYTGQLKSNEKDTLDIYSISLFRFYIEFYKDNENQNLEIIALELLKRSQSVNDKKIHEAKEILINHLLLETKQNYENIYFELIKEHNLKTIKTKMYEAIKKVLHLPNTKQRRIIVRDKGDIFPY